MGARSARALTHGQNPLVKVEMTTFTLRYPLIISSIFLPLRAKSRKRMIKDGFQFSLKSLFFRPTLTSPRDMHSPGVAAFETFQLCEKKFDIGENLPKKIDIVIVIQGYRKFSSTS
jgi:hypothetical protein